MVKIENQKSYFVNKLHRSSTLPKKSSGLPFCTKFHL
jgi:hypothetical protein